MRRRARRDAHHAAIVEALRQAGASVLDLAAVGQGCPDLLVGWRGRDRLVEVKAPLGPQGGSSRDGQRLNGDQERFARAWRGRPVLVVRGPQHAVLALAAMEQRGGAGA